MNGRRSRDEVERRIQLHLEPYFGGWRMTDITTPDVRDYIVQRQASTEIVRRAHDVKRKDGTIRRVPEQRRTIAAVSNAEINRELTILKRMFTLDSGREGARQTPHPVVARRQHADRLL
jgi:hypothetical protein